ncbi:MAG: hypothetical protein HC853_00370 [Anaerolineae bacterium]|nr:hypothetical protein [Anaerolineae bacterium]
MEGKEPSPDTRAHPEIPEAAQAVEALPQFPISLIITFDGGLTGAGLAYGRYHLTCSVTPALRLPQAIDVGKLVVFGQKITSSSDATEYLAVFTALRHAQRLMRQDKVDLNLVQVQVFSDSRNLTQQLQHNWHTRSPELLHLQTQLELELARFGRWQVNWLGKLYIDHRLKGIPLPTATSHAARVCRRVRYSAGADAWRDRNSSRPSVSRSPVQSRQRPGQ